MSSWAAGFGIPAVLAIVTAGGFLRVRYRGVGYLFGPRSRWWAIIVILMITAVMTGVGIVLASVILSVSEPYRYGSESWIYVEVLGLYYGALAAGGLWLWEVVEKWLREPDSSILLADWITFPLRMLEDRMAADMANWCDERVRIAAGSLSMMAKAADYYYHFGKSLERVASSKEQRQQLAELYYSIRQKIAVARLIETGATAERVLAALQANTKTRNISRYSVDDLPLLGRRLLSEAENDLGLLLAILYRLRYRRWLTYSSSRLASGIELWPDIEAEETPTESQEYVSSVEPDSMVKSHIKVSTFRHVPDFRSVEDPALPSSIRSAVSQIKTDPPPNYSVISEMAHSMKTPLAHLEGVVQLLQRGVSVDSRRADVLREMTASIEICRATLAAYRELARVSGQVEPGGPESLDAALQRMHKIYARQSKKKTKLEVNVPASVEGYSNNYILAILLPLLENAVEASPDTAILITAQRYHESVEFLVENNIEAPVDIHKIVQRGETTKPGHEGLGISVVKHLVSEYVGAATSCEIRDGKFVFVIRLPGRQS